DFTRRHRLDHRRGSGRCGVHRHVPEVRRGCWFGINDVAPWIACVRCRTGRRIATQSSRTRRRRPQITRAQAVLQVRTAGTAVMEQAKKAPQADTTDLGLVADLFYRQYDILYRLTTQMLATRSLDDKLSLVLDAVTSELGYAHSAVGLID